MAKIFGKAAAGELSQTAKEESKMRNIKDNLITAKGVAQEEGKKALAEMGIDQKKIDGFKKSLGGLTPAQLKRDLEVGTKYGVR